jgi:NTE family protein
MGLVLQGGGALGAYEYGAVTRLVERGWHPIFGFCDLATISVSLYAGCNGSQKIDNLNSPRNWLKKRKLVHKGAE